jgi:hypothetical protein
VVADPLSRQPARKTTPTCLFLRGYLGVALAVWAAVVFVHVPDGQVPNLLLLTLPALLLLINLSAFPWKYSLVGPYERTPLPPERPVSQQLRSRGRVGRFSARGPFLTWSFYNAGLAVSVLGRAAAFIPHTLIDAVEGSREQGVIVRHRSPEVRSPLLIPGGEVAATLLQHHRTRALS